MSRKEQTTSSTFKEKVIMFIYCILMAIVIQTVIKLFIYIINQ